MSGTPDGRSRVISEAITLEQDQHVEGVELALVTPGTVKVIVRGSDDQGASGRVVFLRDEEGRHTEFMSLMTTNSAGEATIHGVSPGRYSAFARGGSEATQESSLFEVVAGETAETTLLLEPGAVLIASLKYRGDDEVVGARIQVLDPQGLDVSRRIGITDMQYGQAYPPHERRFGPLGSGRYTVIAMGSDGRKGKRRVTLEAGSEKRVTIVLK